jgi:hypothetical protein
MKRTHFIYPFCTGLLYLAALTGCSGGNNPHKPDPTVQVNSIDTNLLFDGKSLNGWEITNFGPQGPVYVSGGEIILGMGDGCTGITFKRGFPEINYEVSLDARKIDGNDFFCGMTFPVGKDPCTLIIGGWGGTTVGLSSIDGMDASENETTTLRKFEKNQWYHIRLSVTPGDIQAWIDSTRVVDLKITGRKLSIRPEVELSKPFGIVSWRTTAALRNIRVEKISSL